ncbi:spore germination protein [Bacillus sp. EAC]|uniref:spore germination protein n=1 Tax=Bacillus sp. EAC TaxID=1978338 RepID=UPI0015C50981|nr:spore germination protein [Bacillus sp. EAC]
MVYSNEKNRNKKLSVYQNFKCTLKTNSEIIHHLFPTADLIEKDLYIGDKPARLFFLSGFIDDQKIDLFINNLKSDEIEIFVRNNMVSTNKVNEVEKAILAGKSILLFDGDPIAYVYSTEKMPQRNFAPPSIDNSLKGSKIAFVETANTNIALLRRFITNKDLKTKQKEIGKKNKNRISIMYIEEVVDQKLLTALEERITNLDADKIINANQLAQLIEENSLSPFPQILTTERPDEAATQLLIGRVVIILDGSSEVIVLPAPFLAFFKSIDDYSSRTLVATFTRILRLVAIMITLFLPGIYIAIVSFNYEIVPLKLLVSIGESRVRVPFDPLVEAFLMEITLELLREAGIRLPSPISTTVGVVGGIVIGQAAVQAGIVSNIMVIIVALTAISSFIIPNYEMASSIRIIRFPIMVMASLFGIVGIIVSTMVLIIHILSLKSFTLSYSRPFSPVIFNQLMDTVVRAPLNFIWQTTKKENK